MVHSKKNYSIIMVILLINMKAKLKQKYSIGYVRKKLKNSKKE